MKMKGHAKCKGISTSGLRNDLMNLVNFHDSSRKSGNLHFDGLLLSKAYNPANIRLDEDVLKTS